MASYKLTLALFAMLAITYVAGADKWKCYSCKGCEEVDDKTEKVDCDGENKCYISGDADKEKWDRGCSTADYCTKHATEFKDHECSQCTDDECNSASWVSGGVFLTVAATGIAMAAMRV